MIALSEHLSMPSNSDFRSTHRLVYNDAALSSGDDEDAATAVENVVVDAVSNFGTEVRIAGDFDWIRERVPRMWRGLERFEPVPADERRLTGGPERRAPLPQDAAAVAAALDFDGDWDEDAWVARLFYVDEFAIYDDEQWRYRSVPHETHVRDLNADGADDMLEAVRDALADVPGVAVFPTDDDLGLEPLARWEAHGVAYTLSPTSLRVTGEGGGTHRFSLDSLEYVRAYPDRRELACQWRRGGSSLLSSGFRRIVRRFTADRPTRLRFETRRELAVAERTLRELREALDYAYRIE